MDEIQGSRVAMPVIKAASAWAAVGITSWTDIAAVLAAIYSMCLILEWCWKVAKGRGWIK